MCPSAERRQPTAPRTRYAGKGVDLLQIGALLGEKALMRWFGLDKAGSNACGAGVRHAASAAPAASIHSSDAFA